ncbi:enoyl-CoA hydratase-related protein, partial [Nocardia sp. NPDC050717]|uniref:enoyl-CoA hydratase-related protein n=1 Tax=Nocardia sp. NPDC050717 TaxID=3157221 RepID=UPI003401FDD3
MTDFETILLERKGGSEGKGAVGWITLNRPKALNALNKQVLDDVIAALDELEADDSIGAVVITGSEKAFAAGADIKEMAPQSYMDMYMSDFFAGWDRLANFR